MFQVILNLIEFGMTPQEAVEAPRFQTDAFYSSFAMHEYVPGKRISRTHSESDRRQTRPLGHLVTMTGPWSNASSPIVIKVSGNVLEGGADPRRGRFINGN